VKSSIHKNEAFVKNQILRNVTETIKNNSTTQVNGHHDLNHKEGEEYEDEIGEEEDEEVKKEEEDSNSCDKKSFVDKLKIFHEEGKSSVTGKNVKNINESFALLESAQKVFGSLFETDKRETSKLLEFLSEIDLDLSPECMSAFVRIIYALREKHLWAVKCKLRISYQS
jgi:hypothetical protein